MKYYPHIDGLRAIAVLLVLCSHLEIINGGFVGVDIFFVISGFLITKISLKELNTSDSFSFLNFYVQRAKRLLPSLFTVILLSLVLGFVVLSPADYVSLAKSSIVSIFSVSNFYFFSQVGYWDTEAITKPLLHTWSLGVEEQFYFVWPILLVLAFKFFKRGIIPLIAVILIISLGFNIYYINIDTDAMYYLPWFRFYGLLLGVLLAYFNLKEFKNSIISKIVILNSLLILAYSIYSFKTEEMSFYYSLVASIIAVILIYFANNSRLLSFKPLVWIGKMSYTLYLVHWVVIVFYTYTFTFSKLDSYKTKTIIFFIVMILTILIHKFIENPFRFRKYELKSAKIKVLIKYLLSGILISLLSIIIIFTVKKPYHFTVKKPYHSYLSYRASNTYMSRQLKFENNFQKMNLPYKKQKIDYIVTGSSYAGMIVPIFDTIAQKSNKNILQITMSAWNALANFPDGKLRRNLEPQKEEFVDHVRSVIKVNPSVVFIVNLDWKKQLRLYDNKGNNRNTKAVTIKEINVINKWISRFQKLYPNNKIIIFGTLPDTKLKFKIIPLSIYNSPKVNLSKNVIDLNNAIKSATKKYENVYFIDLIPSLCSKNVCYANRYIPPRDSRQHISVEGAIYLIPAVESQLVKYGIEL